MQVSHFIGSGDNGEEKKAALTRRALGTTSLSIPSSFISMFPRIPATEDDEEVVEADDDETTENMDSAGDVGPADSGGRG